MLHPCQTDVAKNKKQQKSSYDSHTKPCQFAVGNAVWAQNCRQGSHWYQATVTECLCNVMFKVQLDDQCDAIWRRHANHFRIRNTPVNIGTANNTDSNSNDAESVSDNSLPLRRSSQVHKSTCRWVPTRGDVVSD